MTKTRVADGASATAILSFAPAPVAAVHRIMLGVIETGHAMYVKDTDRISNHDFGRAVDIYEVAVALLTANASLRPSSSAPRGPSCPSSPGPSPTLTTSITFTWGGGRTLRRRARNPERAPALKP